MIPLVAIHWVQCEQYRSAIFYGSEEQKKISERLVGVLEEKNYKIATELVPADTFWEAEE